jgi:serpin B
LQSWINEQTGGLLAEQAGQLRLDPQTILAIATTIYYKAAWSSKFNVDATTQDVFHAASGDETCDFMHQSGTGTYYWGDKFSAISRGMKVNGGTMWFVLPDEGVSVNDLLADDETMDFLLSGGRWENQKRLIVNQSIPKFDVVSEMDLSAGLKALGITDAFDPQLSDYTPMTTERDDICLSKAQHDARVIIDEEGVEAAAFTVLAMATSAMPPKDEVDFVADRPFLFMITGADHLPLFVGMVNHP